MKQSRADTPWAVQYDDKAQAALRRLSKAERREVHEALSGLPSSSGAYPRVTAASSTVAVPIGSLTVHVDWDAKNARIIVRRVFEDGKALDIVDPGHAARRHAMLRMAAFGWSAILAVAVAVGISMWLTAPPPAPTGTRLFVEADRTHTSSHVTYDRVPPAGGDHPSQWLNCGIYSTPVKSGSAVHSLEHGAVWVTYRPNVPSAVVTELRALVESQYLGSQRYIILSPFPGLPTPITATAWGAQLRVNSPSDARLQQFIEHFRDGPQALEPQASCTNGAGTPQF